MPPVIPPDSVVWVYVHSCPCALQHHLRLSTLIIFWFVLRIHQRFVIPPPTFTHKMTVSQIHRLYHPYCPQDQWCDMSTTISRTARVVTLSCTSTASTIIWLVIEFVMLEWREVEMETCINIAGKESPRAHMISYLGYRWPIYLPFINIRWLFKCC